MATVYKLDHTAESDSTPEYVIIDIVFISRQHVRTNDLERTQSPNSAASPPPCRENDKKISDKDIITPPHLP